MDYVEHTLRFEEQFLSEFACKSVQSKGRRAEIENDGLRTEFQRDRDRILHCKAFRRLKHKTQVFLSPEGDHYRTRLTHTLEVSQIARTISRALRLNEDLTEAIALGHDLGHTPYGHGGERALQSFTHFEHNEQSLRIVDVIEYDGKGMNLTYEVRDGILNHTSKGNPATLEGKVVAWSDRVAYINHDIDDAIRGGVLSESDIPKKFIDAFGTKPALRINSMILDIIASSYNKPKVSPSDEFIVLINELRQFMFERVYLSKAAKSEESKAIDMIKFLYRYFLEDIEKVPKLYRDCSVKDSQIVCDYIATMSDQFAVKTFQDICVPKNWTKL